MNDCIKRTKLKKKGPAEASTHASVHMDIVYTIYYNKDDTVYYLYIVLSVIPAPAMFNYSTRTNKVPPPSPLLHFLLLLRLGWLQAHLISSNAVQFCLLF